MNDKEKKDFHIAMCNCCLIADAMKTCPVCIFNVGLVERPKPVNSEFLKGIAQMVLDMEEQSPVAVQVQAV